MNNTPCHISTCSLCGLYDLVFTSSSQAGTSFSQHHHALALFRQRSICLCQHETAPPPLKGEGNTSFQITINITANPAGGLPGTLLCDIANLLSNGGLLGNLNAIVADLNQIIALLRV